jgi:predicted nucleotidyltransferase
MASKPTPSLASVLFGRQRLRVLALLMLNPALSLHVREIARRTDLRPETLHRELRLLAELGILSRQQSGNQVHYSADPNCLIYDELIGILRKTAGIPQYLQRALRHLQPRIRVAFVFGSVATGTEAPGSDVDVFVLGEVKFAEIVAALRDTEAHIQREVNPVVMSSPEFERKIRAGDRFLRSIMAAPKAYVVGSEDVLGEFGQDKAATVATGQRRRDRPPIRSRSAKSA